MLKLTPSEETPGPSYLGRTLQTANTCASGTVVATFLREPVLNSTELCTMFSVKGESSSRLKGCAIVTHIGSIPASGSWKCSKDSRSALCVHVKAAYEELHTILGTVPTEFDPDLLASAGKVPSKSLGLCNLSMTLVLVTDLSLA